MNLVVREDGISLNLNAVLIFTPMSGDRMIVELPGTQHYIIHNFTFFELASDERVHYKEFEGWYQ